MEVICEGFGREDSAVPLSFLTKQDLMKVQRYHIQLFESRDKDNLCRYRVKSETGINHEIETIGIRLTYVLYLCQPNPYDISSVLTFLVSFLSDDSMLCRTRLIESVNPVEASLTTTSSSELHPSNDSMPSSTQSGSSQSARLTEISW